MSGERDGSAVGAVAAAEVPPHARPPEAGWHWAEWGSELVGTAALLLGGLSAVTLDFSTGSPVASAIPSPSWRLLLTGLLFAGTGALVTISPVGRRSGAHLNPAVSLAFWICGHLHRRDLVAYVAAQCAGGLAAAALVRWWWSGAAASVAVGLTSPGDGVGPGGAAAIEAAMTALLVLVIFACVASSRSARWTPLAVLVTIAVLVWQVAPYTGTSLNPARSLGPAAVTGDWTDFWAYVVGPLGGAVAAAGLWALLPWTTQTAKLFHDPAYRSIFRTLLPARRDPPRPSPQRQGPVAAG